MFARAHRPSPARIGRTSETHLFDPILDLDRSKRQPYCSAAPPCLARKPLPCLIKTYGCYKLIRGAEVVEASDSQMEPDVGYQQHQSAARPRDSSNAVGLPIVDSPALSLSLFLSFPAGDLETVSIPSPCRKLSHYPCLEKQAIPFQSVRALLPMSHKPARFSRRMAVTGVGRGLGFGVSARSKGAWRLAALRPETRPRESCLKGGAAART